VGVAGLVGFFSYRSGQESINHVANHLITEVNQRIDQHLDSYLGNAQAVNQINGAAVEEKILDLNNFDQLGPYFDRQGRIFEFKQINFAGVGGRFIGVGVGPNQTRAIRTISPTDPPTLTTYAIDSQGKSGSGSLGNPVKTITSSYPNQQAWYKNAIKAGKPIWSDLAGRNAQWNPMSFMASAPVYDAQNRFQGVFGIEVELAPISDFLRSLLTQEPGSIFILDRSGLLIASSENESVAPILPGIPQPPLAIDRQNSTINQVTQLLIQKYGSLTEIASGSAKNSDGLERLTAPNFPPVFAKVNAYQDQYGLDWLVITVIPESHYLVAIQNNVKHTILIYGLTLIISTFLGIFIARRIIKPIQQLSQASDALAQGDWQESLPENNAITELNNLAISFNHMGSKLDQTRKQLEDALQESRQIYREMLQSQTDFILKLKPDTTIIFANESYCQALGLTLDEILGQKWIDTCSANNAQFTLSQLARLTPDQPLLITENRDRRSGGHVGWTQWIDQGVFDDQDQLIEIHSVGRDITLLKETEQKLRESQRFIERIAETTPSLLYIYDHIEQRNIYANRSVAEMLGYSRSEIQVMGDQLLTIISHPDDFPKVMTAMQQIKAAQDGEVIELEYRVRDAGGEWHWLLSRDIIFNRTEDGQVWQTLGTAQDITDRKNVELEVRRIQRFLTSIIENIPDMIFVKEAKTLKFLEFNKAGENLLGYSRDELLGKTDYDLFPEEQAEWFVAHDCSILHQGSMVDIPEELIQTRTQGNRILHTKKIPIVDESGKAQYLLGISEDITDQIELKNRLSQLARHTPGMLYQFRMRADGTCHFPYASEGINEIYGVTPEQVKDDATNVFDVLHPDDLERINQSIADSAANLTPWHCEYRVCLPSGNTIWVVGHSTPKREFDGSIIWHGYITDITERKAAENLLIAAKERAEEAENKLQKTQFHLERVNKTISKLLSIDGLTKIANRRCFNIRIKQEWLRLHREENPLSLLLFDVDYFKKYNDSYGHPQGDACLIRIAQCVKKVVQRPADLVARYGGEEFAVILPNTDERGAIAVAQRINAAVNQLAIAHQASQIVKHVTVSIGIATQIPQPETSVKNFIAQADVALYQAKDKGRNQSVSFSSLSEQDLEKILAIRLNRLNNRL
jgi:diguanylate cyclase (GGDEF)-like protein/PAS domain S-box-containing protein